MDNETPPAASSASARKSSADWAWYRPRLEVYLSSFSGLGPDGIDEALQSCLIALWKRNPDLSVNARPWLYRVARNAALDLLRSRKRDSSRRAESLPDLHDLPDHVSNLPSPYPKPEDCLLGAEEESFVSSFLEGLEDTDRELLHLAFAEDMSYPEIASLLGRPLGTVKWKIAVLKRRLASRYEKEFG